jgi:hypothetical protein
MKKLAALFVMLLSLLTGSGLAAQDRPQERRQGNRIQARRTRERGRVIRRRHHRRNRRHHMMNQRPGQRRGRESGNHRPPTP